MAAPAKSTQAIGDNDDFYWTLASLVRDDAPSDGCDQSCIHGYFPLKCHKATSCMGHARSFRDVFPMYFRHISCIESDVFLADFLIHSLMYFRSKYTSRSIDLRNQYSMTITIYNDSRRAPLRRELPDWTLDDRTVAWLWMVLRDIDREQRLGLKGLDDDKFGTQAMYQDMAAIVRRCGLANTLNDQKTTQLLSADDLQWIEKGGRQVNWLIREIDKKYKTPRSQCPPGLKERETVVALIDSWNIPITSKQRQLARLKSDWNHHLELDRHYTWFKNGKEKQKCEAAWDWYQKEHGRSLRAIARFSKLEDILFFLDTQEFSLEERQFHIEKIKQGLKRQQARANLKDKKQSNFALSEEVRAQLEGLVAQYGMTRRQIIERLIRNAAINGLDGESAPDTPT